MNEVVAWRTWWMIRDELMNSASSVQISCAVSKRRQNRRVITLPAVGWGTYLTQSSIRRLSVTKYGFSLPWSFSLRSATAARLFSRDPAQGSASLWHTMDPNLRHKEWAKPICGVVFLSLRVIYSFSIHVPVPLPPLLWVFFLVLSASFFSLQTFFNSFLFFITLPLT